MSDHSGIVLFDTKDGLTHEEIWDDSLLIQQYDAAMTKVRHKLDQRRSVNNTTESEQSEAGGNRKSERPGSDGGRGKRDPGGEGVASKKSSSKKKKKKKNKKWQVGDLCRARYSEDGLWYEAAITSLPPDVDPPRCSVRYLGYNNMQELAVERLRRSQGEGARQRQIQQAEEVSESEIGSSIAESDRYSDTDGERSTKRHKPPPSASYRMPSIPPQMPPPPFPGANPFTAPGHLPLLPPPPALAQDPSGDPEASEALHTMLMSWYMTGYHTGYYQALTQAHASK